MDIYDRKGCKKKDKKLRTEEKSKLGHDCVERERA
jgi:hypothetical protein